jgi:hypothetical protein
LVREGDVVGLAFVCVESEHAKRRLRGDGSKGETQDGKQEQDCEEMREDAARHW